MYFGSVTQIELKTDYKKSQIFPFGANLTQLETKSSIPATSHDLRQIEASLVSL